MNRRELGRGRILASLGSVVTLVSIWLPWWRLGGSPGLPELSGIGLSGAGIVLLLAAVLVLALVVLPYAAGDRPMPIDRPATYVVLVALAAAALAFGLFQIITSGGLEALGLPDRTPGLWLAAAGVALMAWGGAEIVSEGPTR